ncbi:unnamed protein product, partial [Mesorhabditis belari]|uniref:CHK kinase-like domain-containing protein n=1 Tax=Mesorhabditis belari TaxID=2138241 RepID=A0AAF3JA02_9BILA
MVLTKAEKAKNDEQIINTAITWEILEYDMQKAFGSLAKIGEKRSAQLMADGNGYVSYIALVVFDWTTDRDLLPEKAVLKITSCDKMEILIKEMPGFEMNNVREKCAAASDNELKFYENAFKTLKFSNELRVPQFFCGRDFGIDGVEAGYFAIEHFDNVENRHFYNNIQESAVLEIIRQLVIIHTHSYNHPEMMGKMDGNVYEQLYGDFADIEKMEKAIHEAGTTYPELKEKLEKLKSQLKHFTNWETYQKKLHESCKTRMFCHGDLWTGNMLWRKDEAGDYRMLVMIDWQLCHLGNPLDDLTRLLTSAISKESYLERRDFYLETYYKWFKENTSGHPMPWESFDEFLKQYEHVFILTTVIFGPLMANFTKMLLEKCREEEKEAGFKCYWGKLENMLDESIKYIEKWNW